MSNFSQRHLVLALLISLLAFGANPTQIGAQEPSPPGNPSGQGKPLSQVQVLKMPPVEVQKLLQEDKQRALQGLPPRFAQPIPVKVSPSTHGTWEKLDPDNLLWRLRIISSDAVSINLGFTHYAMPPGASLFLYTPDYNQIVGPFTDEDNEKHGQLWTPMLQGEEIVIEVALPAAVASQLELALTSVNHGYVEFGRPPDKSGACNVDVICPQGDGWRDEIRSVAVYSVGGFLSCSGALVNNTTQDLTPYFLTANHCGVNAGNAPSVVAYWNYEHSVCRAPDSEESGKLGDGPLDQFNTGAIFRASYNFSDMTLIELDDPISPTFNTHWAGWDNTSADATSATAIHHPNTDEKRISFENDPTTTTAYLSTTVLGNGTHIRVTDWDLGTTEPGSSGSPLFNQDHRIVGQLHGGYAACGNDSSDWYGRLSVSWTGGGTPSTRLKDWLDPGSTGATTLDGKDNVPDFYLTATPANLYVCMPNDAVYDITVGSIMGFADQVTLNVSGNPSGTNANFNLNPVTPPGSSLLTIGNIAAAGAGNYTMNVTGVSPTSTHTSTVTLNLFDNTPGAVNLTSPANGATDVTTTPTFEWSAATQGTTYELEVATNTSFNTIVYSATVASTNHMASTALVHNTTHYWRVTPQNICGSSSASAIFSFTTVDLICSIPNLAIPDNTPAGITNDIVVSDDRSLEDLDVFINATHTYVGDLIFTLEHVNSGTSVMLIDRPGSPATSLGCSGNNIEATLDDEATLPVEDECASTIPTISGSFIPNTPLNAFDGEILTGTWRLMASDNESADTGTLVEWCLVPAVSGPSPPTHNFYLPLILKE